MEEYRENGVLLGWLIDPRKRKAWVYHENGETEELIEPEELTGDPVLPGFRLAMKNIWI